MSAPRRPVFAEVCAGVGGMSRGLDAAGMDCAFHAENAPFPRRVLAHHWPDVPLLSDLRAISGGRKMRAWMRARFLGLLLLAGGTPCQDLSIAGKRAGIAGARSSLYFRFVRLWKVLGCPYLLWENVPGALSSNRGADFAAVLSAIVGGAVPVPADRWRGAGVVAGPTGVAAWRLLDAQYFGVAQRRVRLFVLGARAGGVDPAEVLLEPSGLPRHPASRREAGEGTSEGAGGGVASESGHGWWNADGIVAPLRANASGMWSHIAFHPTQDPISGEDGTGRGTPIVLASGQANAETVRDGSPSLTALHEVPIVFDSPVGTLESRTRGGGFPGTDGATSGHVQATNGIPRRLMPIECERLMGWADSWTDVPGANGKPASDTQRYRACGNGVVSSVPEWIGSRLVAIHRAMLMDLQVATPRESPTPTTTPHREC